MTIHHLDLATSRTTTLFKTEGLYVYQGRPSGVQHQAHRFDTRRSTTVFEHEADCLSMTVSPDEQWILFGQYPPYQSELMLVENFR